MSYFMCIVRPALNGSRVGLDLAGVGHDYSIRDQ